MTRSLLATTAPALTLASGGAQAQTSPEAVLDTYADIAEAAYGDSLSTARALSGAVDALIASPSDETLAAAKAAWITARVPYQQTEVFRFGNAIVNEGKTR